MINSRKGSSGSFAMSGEVCLFFKKPKGKTPGREGGESGQGEGRKGKEKRKVNPERIVAGKKTKVRLNQSPGEGGLPSCTLG